MILTKRNTCIGLICLAIVAIFYPDSAQQNAQHRALKASLSGTEDGTSANHRRLSEDIRVDISEFHNAVTCDNPGESFGNFDWDVVQLDKEAEDPQEFSSGGVSLSFSRAVKGDAKLFEFGMDEVMGADGVVHSYPTIGIEKILSTDEFVGPEVKTPAFPDSYVSLIIEFSEPLRHLSISNGDVDSGKSADVVRIEMFDEFENDVPLKLAANHSKMVIVDDYAWMSEKDNLVVKPGYETSLYAMPQDGTIAVKKIVLELGLFTFHEWKVGTRGARKMYPGLDFKFCKYATDAPTPAPTPLPTPYPIAVRTPSPEALPLPPVAPPTAAPTRCDGIVNDPMVLGLNGQVFKFDGRSGAWYSAVSTKSFQWNMKISKFEGCPANSNTFTTGMGLTLFGEDGMDHQIEVGIVNPASVYTGCGNHDDKDADFGCLGAGSLELVVDGHKVVRSFDRFLDDDTRVTAYNTISKCSRRWFDFDVTPAHEIQTRQTRRMEQIRGTGIFETIDSAKETMVDKEGCLEWINERRNNNDILQQTGTWSTVVIKTELVSFHIEYRQEMERCNAHNLDVWITEVSPSVNKESWEGVVGETKTTNGKKTGERDVVSRLEALKYGTDEEYEVISPYSTECQACVDRDN